MTPSKPLVDKPEKPDPNGGHGWKVLTSVPFDQAPPVPPAVVSTPELPSDASSVLEP